MDISIFYHAATANMDDRSEQEAANYRAWAENEIKSAYPCAKIEVLDGIDSSRAYVFATLDGGLEFEDDDEEEAILAFLAELWDRCPWSGEFFD